MLSRSRQMGMTGIGKDQKKSGRDMLRPTVTHFEIESTRTPARQAGVLWIRIHSIRT